MHPRQLYTALLVMASATVLAEPSSSVSSEGSRDTSVSRKIDRSKELEAHRGDGSKSTKSKEKFTAQERSTDKSKSMSSGQDSKQSSSYEFSLDGTNVLVSTFVREVEAAPIEKPPEILLRANPREYYKQQAELEKNGGLARLFSECKPHGHMSLDFPILAGNRMTTYRELGEEDMRRCRENPEAMLEAPSVSHLNNPQYWNPDNQKFRCEVGGFGYKTSGRRFQVGYNDASYQYLECRIAATIVLSDAITLFSEENRFDSAAEFEKSVSAFFRRILRSSEYQTEVMQRARPAIRPGQNCQYAGGEAKRFRCETVEVDGDGGVFYIFGRPALGAGNSIAGKSLKVAISQSEDRFAKSEQSEAQSSKRTDGSRQATASEFFSESGTSARLKQMRGEDRSTGSTNKSGTRDELRVSPSNMK